MNSNTLPYDYNVISFYEQRNALLHVYAS